MRYILVLLVLIAAVGAHAQNFGGNVPTKWSQINTRSARVIFPVGMDSVANRIASIANTLQKDSSAVQMLKKINVLVQPNATISNAYVSLAPYRAEFYLMPPQNAFKLGSLSWADNLAIHEWRHVQQYNYFNRGLSKAAGVILGEEGRALFNALAVPDWFFEGDAVWNETKFSKQGRGRLPLAFSGYKSLFLEGRHYSYMKLRNGSLKDYVPDHYDLGYLLVAYGAEKYGKDFWNKVTADAAAFKPLIYPLQGAIKKYAGISFTQFVDEAMNYYQKQWKQEIDETEMLWLTHARNYRTDYLFPYADEQGRVIAVKQSSKNNPAFYFIDKDGNEQRIASQDITQDRYFSYRNGRVVYATYAIDARWVNREYSNVTVLDVASGLTRTITSKARYFSPDITANGNQVVAVEIKPDQSSRLALLDDKGEVTQSINGAAGEIFSQPKFSYDDKAVYVAVRNAKGLMSLRKYELEKSNSKSVVAFGNYIIGFIAVNKDTVLFTATTKTKDEVYGWVEGDQKLYHLASYPTGLYQSTLVNGKLVSSAFTSAGYRLAVINPKWKEVNGLTQVTDLYVDKALEANISVEKIPTERFAYRKYSKLSHPFNLHSWRPYYDPPEYSFNIYGQNVLNTVATELAYIYNENENTHAAAATIVYGGTFLQPFVTGRNTWNRTFAFTPDTVAHWNELEFGAGLQLPLNLSKGKMFRFVTASVSYRADNLHFTGANKNLFRGTNVNYLLSRLTFSSQIQKAAQHIFPKFGIAASLQLRSALNLTANQFLATGSLYLPGIGKTHSTVLSFAYQGRDTIRQYGFANNFPFSRGYDVNIDYPRMWKVGANYHFPLLHPDWGFGNIVYFLRIRANAFTDYTEIQSLRTGAVFSFQSVGGEIYFDTRWWNQQPVSFGVRYSRLLNGDLVGLAANQWEFILPVGLIPNR